MICQRSLWHALAVACVSLLTVMSQAAHAQAEPKATASASAHRIGAAKLIIGDVQANQRFYESMFGLKEVAHYRAEGVYDEPILGYDAGARLALFSPLKEAPLAKSPFPVALLYVPDVEAVAKRLEANRLPVRRLPANESAKYRIAIATDPSGNAIELLERANEPMSVGGAKLIVNDRESAEKFYGELFGVQPIARFTTPTYDEVLMGFGPGAWLALFQPKAAAPLPKSRFPVVAIYTKEFDAVVAKLKALAVQFREVPASAGSRIVIATDPAGNAVEIIREAA